MNLWQYINNINQIIIYLIIYPGFTLLSDNELNTKKFSGRDNSKEQYDKNKLFSVIFILLRISNWIIIEKGKKLKR